MSANSNRRLLKGPRIAVYTALAVAVTALALTPSVERSLTGTTVSLLAAKAPQMENIDERSIVLVRASD